jgi:hypothetical protein
VAILTVAAGVLPLATILTGGGPGGGGTLAGSLTVLLVPAAPTELTRAPDAAAVGGPWTGGGNEGPYRVPFARGAAAAAGVAAAPTAWCPFAWCPLA